MKRLYTVLAVLLVALSQGYASSRVVEQAEARIRNLITMSGTWSKVFFSRSNEQFISTTESRVTGDGLATRDNNWGGTPFRYSIKVNRSNVYTRGAVIRFADGTNLNAKSDWEPAVPGGYDVRFDSPSWYQDMASDNVTFSGFASGIEPVLVTVFDRAGVQRAFKSVRPQDGRWLLSMVLPPGTYRAIASYGGYGWGDEVRFTIRNQAAGDWGFPGKGWSWSEFVKGQSRGRWVQSGPFDRWIEDNPLPSKRRDEPKATPYVTIDTPQPGQRLRTRYISASGTAYNTSSVRIELFRGTVRVAYASSATAGGRWTFGASVSQRGTYRLTVKPANGGARKEVRFSVD